MSALPACPGCVTWQRPPRATTSAPRRPRPSPSRPRPQSPARPGAVPCALPNTPLRKERPPVHIWGWGQGHPGQPMANGSEFGLVTGAVQAGRTAMGMAGVGPADVTMCQIYDCYTYTVLVTLEDYGFCAKGEGGPFAASGALAPGGSLPVNTGGGH